MAQDNYTCKAFIGKKAKGIEMGLSEMELHFPGADFQHKRCLDFLESIPLKGIDSLLDAGAGKGLQSQWFREHGVKKVLSLDLAIPPGAPVPYISGNISKMVFRGNSFDAIWCNQVLEHVLAPLVVLKEFHRVTKRGGWLFLAVPTHVDTISTDHIHDFSWVQIVYLLVLAGYNVREGYWQKSGSTLRCAVKKLSSPIKTKVIKELAEAKQLPRELTHAAISTGRLHGPLLQEHWFTASKLVDSVGVSKDTGAIS